jgi:hypothetical protein
MPMLLSLYCGQLCVYSILKKSEVAKKDIKDMKLKKGRKGSDEEEGRVGDLRSVYTVSIYTVL